MREYVRWHMQCVRCGWRNAGIGSCRRKSLWRELCIVARVDEVVRDSGVLRVGAIKRLKQMSRLLLLRMRLVGRRCVRQERERVKHLYFDVFPVHCSEII